MEIKWEDPPEAAILRSRSNGRYVEFAISLRAHEERWALLPELDGKNRSEKAAQSTAQNIRRGITKGFDKNQYEAVADGGKVYVRFMPKETPVDLDEKFGDPQDPDRTRKPTTEEGRAIRAWARKHGFEVADRGALPQNVIDAYHAAGE